MATKIFKYLFGLVIIFLTNTAIGQIAKFKSTSLSLRTKNESTGNWTKWSDLEKVELLIVLDIQNDRVKIYSREEQVYDIIKYYEKEVDYQSDETMRMLCIDREGLKCNIRFVKLNSQNGRHQLYVDFADVMWMYNIFKLD